MSLVDTISDLTLADPVRLPEGVRTGTIFAIISVAALVASPIGGAIITRWNGSYVGLQIFAGVMCTAGAVVMLLARIRLAGVGLKTKV